MQTIRQCHISGCITVKRRFHRVTDISHSDSGAVLNRFTGTAREDEYSDMESDGGIDSEFEQSAGSSPILRDLSKGKTIMRGGTRGNLSQRMLTDNQSFSGVSIFDHVRRSYRSKRSEERYKLSHMVFEGPIRVRIMDVDAFNLSGLHNYFM